jgi:Probable sensor domain DACNV
MELCWQSESVSKVGFDFPDAIAELVYAHWTDVSFAPGYRPGPRPALPVLADLMNLCFFASLRREEERVTEFDLALCSPDDLPEAAFGFSKFTRVFNVICFDEARRLTVDELVRLAPACHPDKTIILVGHDGHTGDLYLWGLVDVGWRPSVISMSLMELRVRVFGPGEMKITLHGRVCCTFKDGRIFNPEQGLINTGCVYEFFKESSLLLSQEVKSATGQGDDTVVLERNHRTRGYLFVLQQIIERMQQLQHGGCILIIPDMLSTDCVPCTTVKYRCQDDMVWNYMRGRLILDDQFQREDVESGLRDALDALVRLTAVDGAVLMTRKFELLGFGAVVQLPQSVDYKVYRCHDRQALQATEVEVESYGTRHRSAFEFCYRCAPSVAIVASQDGDIKVITRVGDHVFFWENTLFDTGL